MRLDCYCCRAILVDNLCIRNTSLSLSLPPSHSHLLSSTLQGIDVKSMGRIFIGIVKCGAWGCFDEFNRLEEAVLSAVSTQIQAIQAAIRSRASTCDLLDRKVSRRLHVSESAVALYIGSKMATHTVLFIHVVRSP